MVLLGLTISSYQPNLGKLSNMQMLNKILELSEDYEFGIEVISRVISLFYDIIGRKEKLRYNVQ